MKLIDKAAVVAEIEKRIKEIEEIGTYLSPKGTLTNLLCYIDTLEVKGVEEEPVNEDLEETAKFYAATHTEFFDSEGKPHVAPAFIAGAKWKEEQIMTNLLLKQRIRSKVGNH